MSKMSELAQTLDELTEIGRQLAACGESLIRTANCVKECFSTEEEDPKPAKTAGRRKTEKAPDSVQDPSPAAEPEKPAPRLYKKEEVRAALAELAQSGHRDAAKALVKKYSDGGSLTDVDPTRYPELMQEVQSCHG